MADTTTSDRKKFFKRLRKGEQAEQTEMSFVDHLEALRWHIMRGVIAWLVAAITIFIFRDWIFDNLLLAPTRESFVTYGALCHFGRWLGVGDGLCMPPVDIKMQITEISGSFTSALNISMIGGVIAAFPYLFWELWRFIKPALSDKEKKYATGSIFWVSLCFFVGVAFGYYLLAPFTFNFLATFQIGTENIVKYEPTLTDYIDSLTNIILGCGIAFELPILAYVLGKIGLISARFLKTYRKYAFVIILLVAAIITPSPDMTSQILVSLPLLLLYEISVLLVARIDKKRAKEEKEWS